MKIGRDRGRKEGEKKEEARVYRGVGELTTKETDRLGESCPKAGTPSRRKAEVCLSPSREEDEGEREKDFEEMQFIERKKRNGQANNGREDARGKHTRQDSSEVHELQLLLLKETAR